MMPGERGHQDALPEVELLDRPLSSCSSGISRSLDMPGQAGDDDAEQADDDAEQDHDGPTSCREPCSTNSPWKIGGISVPNAAQ